MKNIYQKLALVLAVCGIAVASSATQLVHVYTFDDNLSDFVSDVTLQSSGGTVENQEYMFDPGQGLSVTSTAFSSANYSVELRFSIDAFINTYTKIIDTSDLQSDSGLYVRLNQIMYYPTFRLGDITIGDGDNVHVVMTRDSQNVTRVYVNGLFQLVLEQEDSAVVNNTLHFFKDDVVTINEESGGRVELIRIYDGALTPTQIAALADGGDLLIEKDLASPGDGLITLDLGTNTEWLDVTETQDVSVDSINADEGGWVSAGFRVAERVEFNAMWHAAGISAFNDPTEANLPTIQNFISLFGCTFGCGFGNERSSGLYKKLPGVAGSVAGISEARIDTSTTPVTGEARNCCTVTLDRDENIWGVHILREVVIADADGDGINDQIDNCTDLSNPGQLDSDKDGYGNRCDGDLNNDGTVNFLDISDWAPFFNTTADGVTDLNEDGQTNFLDYVILTGFYLQSPGPSSYHLQ